MPRQATSVNSLSGQLLLAMPQMDDPRFMRSVVFLFAHSEDDGASGIIVNKTIDLTIDQLYAHLKIEKLTHPGEPHTVHFGGPVEPGLGFVLHSADYRDQGTVAMGGGFAITATFDILRAMATGIGPEKCLLALGYAGWAPGQLETEIKANGWLSVAADAGIVFDPDDGGKWQRALAKLGVTPEMLSAGLGHA